MCRRRKTSLVMVVIVPVLGGVLVLMALAWYVLFCRGGAGGRTRCAHMYGSGHWSYGPITPPCPPSSKKLWQGLALGKVPTKAFLGFPCGRWLERVGFLGVTCTAAKKSSCQRPQRGVGGHKRSLAMVVAAIVSWQRYCVDDFGVVCLLGGVRATRGTCLPQERVAFGPPETRSAV